MNTFNPGDVVRDRNIGGEAKVIKHDDQQPELVHCEATDQDGEIQPLLFPARNLAFVRSGDLADSVSLWPPSERESSKCAPGTCPMCDAMPPGMEPLIGTIRLRTMPRIGSGHA